VPENLAPTKFINMKQKPSTLTKKAIERAKKKTLPQK
jgi:hypothetical protein